MKNHRTRIAAQRLGLILLMVLGAQSAFAHPQRGEAVGFLTGFCHPISGLDHVLAMVAVGLWGAQLGSSGDLASSCRVSHGDGDGRNAWPSWCAASRN